MSHGKLRFWDVFCIGAGSMISSGIFVLPALAYAKVGEGLIVSYFLAGFLVLPALFTKMELVTALPKSGGAYFFLDRILGAPVGMIAGVTNWFSIAFKSAFALLGFDTFIPLLFPDISNVTLKIIAVGICLIFMCFNLFSVKSSGSMQILLVVGLLIILVEFIIYGQRSIDFQNFTRIDFTQFHTMVAVAGMVFISYGGVSKITSIAEDVPDKRSLVRATMLAFLVVQCIYLLVIMVLVGVLPQDVFQATPAPLSTASHYLSSHKGLNEFHVIVTVIAAILAFITTANAGIMTASRVPLAMSRDKMLPSIFAKTAKNGVPVVGVLFTTALMILSILFFDLEGLAKLASLFLLLLFMGNEISLIIIRYAKVYNYKPIYKSPWFPWMQIIGIAMHLAVIISMGWEVIIEGFLYIVLSLLMYFFYARRQVTRRSAFYHLISHITKREFRESEEELNDELMDILLNREGIQEDEFDALIRHIPIVDMTEEIAQAEAIEIIASHIETDLPSCTRENIIDNFKQREQVASTLIPIKNEFVALPHIVLGEGKGRGIFGMCIVRNLSGITWEYDADGNPKKAHTIFALYCSEDQRTKHLQTIMNIAQSLQDSTCYKDWKQAESPEALRSAFLLAKRNRQYQVENIVGV